MGCSMVCGFLMDRGDLVFLRRPRSDAPGELKMRRPSTDSKDGRKPELASD